jgi:hypothetical protein
MQEVSKIVKSDSASEKWLATDDAVEKLGKSKATLYRLVAAGEIRSKEEKRPGRKPERLFAEADIEHVLASNVRITPARQLAIASAPRQLPARSVPVTGRLVLRIDEAAQEFGLPASYITELCREAKIAAIRRGAWFLSRKSLERFIENGFIGAL